MSKKNGCVPVYMASVVPGLEAVASEEICGKFPETKITEVLRGKVFFSYPNLFKDLFALKCVDNIYFFIGSFPVGPHKADLTRIGDKIRVLDVKNKLKQANIDIEKKRMIVSASRSGKHTYSRFDAAEAVLEAMLQYNPVSKGTTEQHDIAIRFDVIEDKAYIYCKLTPAAFRFRGRNREFLSGALRPSVAHAMVLLSEPEHTDVFLDPFCGSGTIVYERTFYDAYSIMASDLSPERLKAAKRNLPDHVGINCWDACHTELKDNSVNKIVSNLPWGKQIEVDDINRLYTDFLKEAKRIVSPDGKIVLLTDEERALGNAAAINDLNMVKICTLSLHGLHPSIFLLTV